MVYETNSMIYSKAYCDKLDSRMVIDIFNLTMFDTGISPVDPVLRLLLNYSLQK